MRIQGNIRRLTHLVSCVGSMRWSHLVLSAVMFGVLIRIIHFGFGRMLWLDEATIAINFVTRDGFEHFLALRVGMEETDLTIRCARLHFAEITCHL